MSKGFNKILDFMKLNDNEYDDYDDYNDEIDDDSDENIEEAPKKTFSKSTSSRTKRSGSGHEDRKNYDEPDDELTDRKKNPGSYSSRKSSYGRSSKIVPMRSSTSSRSMEVCVSKPLEFDTCQEISDIILSGRAAIINFSGVTSQEAQRIIDFVSGACYAINGSAKQISDTIVVVTPEDIDITGDLQDMASSNVDVPSFGYSEEDN